MTVRQTCIMLCMEGAGYGVISLAISLTVGIPFSISVFQGLASSSVTYEIPWRSSFILFVAAVGVCLLVPVVVYRWTQNTDVIERLQRGEDSF